MEIERLIGQCRQGDEEALGNLYKAYAQRMRGICQRYVNDRQAVDDVLHDAFVVIFTSFDKLRNEKKAEAWMTGIVRNVALKHEKFLKAVKTVPHDEVNEEVLSAAAESDFYEPRATFEELMQMVDRLPEGYGKVFRLSVFEGMSHKEIAEQLGIEPHSSSSQLTRAKKMMRKMIKRYWIWLLIPLLIPVLWIILDSKKIDIDKNTTYNTSSGNGTTDIKEDKPYLSESGKNPKACPAKQSAASAIDNLQTGSTHFSSPDTIHSVIAQTAHVLISDMPLPMQFDTISPLQESGAPQYNTIRLPYIKSRNPKDWNLIFTFNGSIRNDVTRVNDYMTVLSHSGGTTRSARLYNWGEYMEYVMENGPEMDSLNARNMYRVALINSNHPKDPITEKSKHDRPLTFQLLFNRQFNSHWSITAGLSYTRMKSTFESGNENTLICREQRINYLGIPLKVNFGIVENNRLNLYTSGGLQLDFPVNARLATKYLYRNAYESIGNSPDINTRIHAPCQLSLGIGFGIQYQIFPHINIFLEPGISYFIPNGQGIETYYTEHPFHLSLPVGIKLSW